MTLFYNQRCRRDLIRKQFVVFVSFTQVEEFKWICSILPMVVEFKYPGILSTSAGKRECESDKRIRSAASVPVCSGGAGAQFVDEALVCR